MLLKIIKKIFKILFISLSSVIALLLIMLLVIRINSTGNAEPILDKNGDIIENSISEIMDTLINGAPQRLTIRGTDISNPILLKIHGGPASAFIHPWAQDTALEKRFVVCYWDQRGGGPAYTQKLPKSSFTLDQIVEDGIAVSKFLLERFGRNKIFIMGNSWGTAVGAFMVKQQPDLYSAYIGIGQMANQSLSEKLSYDFVWNKAMERKDTVAIEKLQGIGPPPYETTATMVKAVKIERYYVKKYAPIQAANPDALGALTDFLLYDGLTFNYKLSFLSGDTKNNTFDLLWPECTNINLIRDIPQWEIPVFIIQGAQDHFTETSLAKTYYDALQAPFKEWFLFENSTHMPDLEEPGKYREVLDEIIAKTK